MLPDYNGINSNSRKITGITGIFRSLNQTFLNNTWVKEGISREIEEVFEPNENENTTKFVGYTESSSWGDIYSLNA